MDGGYWVMVGLSKLRSKLIKNELRACQQTKWDPIKITDWND